MRITSSGDLEVLLLYENHDLLADLVSGNHYVLLGSPPCEVGFHTNSAFWNFIVHATELFSEGSGNASINGCDLNLSLFSAAEWFCEIHPEDAEQVGLHRACVDLREWLDSDPVFSFWSGDLSLNIQFPLQRRAMINFAANFHKHSLLRLGRAMERLRKLCKDSGVDLQGLDVVSVREPFLSELESRLLYLSTWFVELLGKYFLSLNRVVSERYKVNRTNNVDLMRIPDGVTSDAMRGLYGSTLVFKNYDSGRITRFIPTTPDLLKRRY